MTDWEVALLIVTDAMGTPDVDPDDAGEIARQVKLVGLIVETRRAARDEGYAQAKEMYDKDFKNEESIDGDG